jgi:hypothetical protein
MKKMEHETSKLSKEKFLLLLVIGIGCYGFGLNFQQDQTHSAARVQLIGQYVQNESLTKWETVGPLKMEGSFIAGDPIRFTLTAKEFKGKKIDIDFGNGVSQRLSAPIFTYAYRKQGQFELKIKQKEEVLFQTRLYITDRSIQQLVLN